MEMATRELHQWDAVANVIPAMTKSIAAYKYHSRCRHRPTQKFSDHQVRLGVLGDIITTATTIIINIHSIIMILIIIIIITTTIIPIEILSSPSPVPAAPRTTGIHHLIMNRRAFNAAVLQLPSMGDI